MAASQAVLDKAKVLVLFAFCLLNPFAGWAYLAQVRHAQSFRPPAIVDTLKPKRLAVLPIGVGSSEPFGGDWAQAFEVDFVELDDLEVVPLAETPLSLDVERDVLALGKSVHADYVLDASALCDADGLRLYARLIRLADATVRWSELFVGERGELAEIREKVLIALLRSL